MHARANAIVAYPHISPPPHSLSAPIPSVPSLPKHKSFEKPPEEEEEEEEQEDDLVDEPERLYCYVPSSHACALLCCTHMSVC